MRSLLRIASVTALFVAVSLALASRREQTATVRLEYDCHARSPSSEGDQDHGCCRH